MNNIYKFFLCLTCVSLLKSDAIQNSRNNAITRAIKKVGPAVASINVEQNKKSVPFDPFDPFSGFTIRPREIYPSLTSGSGVIISPDGFLLTNYHVIENAYKITVTLPGGDVYQADIIGSDRCPIFHC